MSDAGQNLANTPGKHTATGPGDQERLLSVPFTTASGDKAVIVVSQETAPYERSEFYALARHRRDWVCSSSRSLG